MRLTRVFVAAPLAPGSLIDLPPDTAAHLAKVLRARGGEEIILFNGDGNEYRGEIDSVRGSRVSASVGHAAPVDRESPLSVTLVQCVPRGDRMDFIVQKATELGVTRIVPVISQRSVVRLDDTQARSKLEHWRSVAVSACEQCGRNRTPHIETPAPLLDYLGDAPASERRWLLDTEEGSNAAPFVTASSAAVSDPATRTSAVEVAVGPEGGFASEERAAFRMAGFVALRLGPRILRTETAAIAALVWVQARHGDLG